ncbi:nitrous oxide reductase accessory protein NosL [Halomonas litopenaei]|uniref:nitrous oxide reductase accessory protein NosL n=1 Tax=Halomonas litopenaei TaxID=2109328 RepID=UPI003FA10D6B
MPHPTMLQRFAITGLILLLIGCDDVTSDTDIGPAPIGKDDICHVCGMLIDAMPGPKGELALAGDSEVTKFCSAAEMLVFLLQPENAERIAHAWVHDMAHTDWERPGNDAFISAQDAWYVSGHSRPGGMGHPLATFSTRSDAEAFQRDHGGIIERFDELELDQLTRMSHTNHP